MADQNPMVPKRHLDRDPGSVRTRLQEIAKQAEVVAEQTDDESIEHEIKEVPIVVDHCLAILDGSDTDE